jgi:hypothetical protein
MKFIFLVLISISLQKTQSFLLKKPSFKYSYSLQQYNSSQTYQTGNIVGFESDRYYCSDNSKCSTGKNPSSESSGWTLLNENESVDLSQDTYEPNKDYTAGNEIIYLQYKWLCKDSVKCDSEEYNPVGVKGSEAWTKKSQVLSSLSDSSNETSTSKNM